MRILEQYIRERPEQFQQAYEELRPVGRLEIEVRLDWRCNAKCKFCGVWKYSREGMLPVARWHEIFSELADNGLAHVLYTGGEPLLYPNFFDVAEYVDELGVESAIISNGSLLDEARVDRLARMRGLREITVSIDSPDPKVHDEVRKMRGLFGRATRGMARLRERAPHVGLIVNTVVSANTAATVKDLLSLPVLPDRLRVFPVGLDMAWLNSLATVEENNWASWAAEAKTERLSRQALEQCRRDIVELREEAARRGVEVELERIDHHGAFRGECTVPMGHFVLQPNGDAYPCCHVQDLPNRIGRLGAQTVAEMFASDTYRDFLRQLRPVRLPACFSCSRYRSFNATAQLLTIERRPVTDAAGP